MMGIISKKPYDDRKRNSAGKVFGLAEKSGDGLMSFIKKGNGHQQEKQAGFRERELTLLKF